MANRTRSGVDGDTRDTESIDDSTEPSPKRAPKPITISDYLRNPRKKLSQQAAANEDQLHAAGAANSDPSFARGTKRIHRGNLERDTDHLIPDKRARATPQWNDNTDDEQRASRGQSFPRRSKSGTNLNEAQFLERFLPANNGKHRQQTLAMQPRSPSHSPPRKEHRDTNRGQTLGGYTNNTHFQPRSPRESLNFEQQGTSGFRRAPLIGEAPGRPSQDTITESNPTHGQPPISASRTIYREGTDNLRQEQSRWDNAPASQPSSHGRPREQPAFGTGHGPNYSHQPREQTCEYPGQDGAYANIWPQNNSTAASYVAFPTLGSRPPSNIRSGASNNVDIETELRKMKRRLDFIEDVSAKEFAYSRKRNLVLYQVEQPKGEKPSTLRGRVEDLVDTCIMKQHGWTKNKLISCFRISAKSPPNPIIARFVDSETSIEVLLNCKNLKALNSELKQRGKRPIAVRRHNDPVTAVIIKYMQQLVASMKADDRYKDANPQIRDYPNPAIIVRNKTYTLREIPPAILNLAPVPPEIG